MRIAAVCARFDVDGLRADLVTAGPRSRTRPGAAGRRSPPRTSAVAARLALPHRRRRSPFDAPGLDEEQLDDALGGPDDDRGPDPPPDGGAGRRRPRAAGRAGAGRRVGRRRRPRATTAIPPRPETHRRGPADRARRPAADPAARAGRAAARCRARRASRSRQSLEAAGTGTAAAGAGRGRVGAARRPATQHRRTVHLTRPRPPPRRTSGAAAGPGQPVARTRADLREPPPRAASPTWSCSLWTPAARWPPGGGGRRSRARCCPCCSTPTSGATRSAWSASAARGRAAAAAHLLGGRGRRRLADAAGRRPDPARGRAGAGPRDAAPRAAPRPAPPPAARRGHRRPGHRRRRPGGRPRGPRRRAGDRGVVVDCESGPVRLGLAGAWRAPRRRARHRRGPGPRAGQPGAGRRDRSPTRPRRRRWPDAAGQSRRRCPTTGSPPGSAGTGRCSSCTPARKGKSTAAFGLALRGWNQGWPIGVYQFVKSAKWRVGEEAALRALAACTSRPARAAR